MKRGIPDRETKLFSVRDIERLLDTIHYRGNAYRNATNGMGSLDVRAFDMGFRLAARTFYEKTLVKIAAHERSIRKAKPEHP